MKNTLVRCPGFVAAILLLFNPSLRAQTGGRAIGNTSLTIDGAAHHASFAEIKPLPVLAAMQRVADWQLAHPSQCTSPPDWTQGAGDAGMMALAGISGDAEIPRRDARDGRNQRLETRPAQFTTPTTTASARLMRNFISSTAKPKMIAPLRERFDAILAKPSDVHEPGIHAAAEPRPGKLVVVRFAVHGAAGVGAALRGDGRSTATWILR